MFDIILYQPEIPPNTGNIMRLCANMGARLHLIRPLGFSLSDKQLTRAGMDYRHRVPYTLHDDFNACQRAFAGRPWYLCTTRAHQYYSQANLPDNAAFLFGAETRGVPEAVHAAFAPDHKLVIPMQPEGRSLNLANSVSIVLYEAWRQHRFAGATQGRQACLSGVP